MRLFTADNTNRVTINIRVHNARFTNCLVTNNTYCFKLYIIYFYTTILTLDRRTPHLSSYIVSFSLPLYTFSHCLQEKLYFLKEFLLGSSPGKIILGLSPFMQASISRIPFTSFCTPAGSTEAT